MLPAYLCDEKAKEKECGNLPVRRTLAAPCPHWLAAQHTPFVGERDGGGPQGCPRFPTLPFHSALPNAPCLLPALCYPALPLPAPVLHNAPRLLLGLHTLPFLSCPRTPLGYVSCPRFRTLPFLACPSAPQSPMPPAREFLPCPCLPAPQCRMPLPSPTALLLQRKGSLLLLAAAILDRPRLLVARGKATPLAHHSLDVREVVVLVFLSFS